MKPKNDELLIRLKGFGLNHTDVMAHNGLNKEATNPTLVRGYVLPSKFKEKLSRSKPVPPW